MNATPFVRDRHVDKPGIIGARWWQKTLADPMPRRKAIQSLLLVTGAIAGAGVVIGLAIKASRPKYEFQPRKALDLQREYGWSFGAATEHLVFNGTSLEPFDRSRLKDLVSDVKPAPSRLAPYHSTTLFEVLGAVPRSQAHETPEAIESLIEVLPPIFTATMKSAYDVAVGLCKALESTRETAVIVDLDGADAVAFAAGLSTSFAPVFLLDNWPHPRGVVPSHLPLAATAYYQPTFAKHAAPDAAPPVFVLDRKRLAAYGDDSTQFDNRYVAKIPSAGSLKLLGISAVVYVAPASTAHELDDLNDDFVALSAAGIDFRIVAAFAAGASLLGSDGRVGAAYSPAPRATDFSSGVVRGNRPTPLSFGTVPVAVALGTGILLGAKISRNGSWNRAGGTGGG